MQHLASRVPYLKLDGFAVNFANTGAELHSDGVRGINEELLVRELRP